MSSAAKEFSIKSNAEPVSVPFLTLDFYSPSEAVSISGDRADQVLLSLVNTQLRLLRILNGKLYKFEPAVGMHRRTQSLAQLTFQIEVLGRDFILSDHQIRLHSFSVADGSLKVKLSTTYTCVVTLAAAVIAYPSFETGALTILDRAQRVMEDGFLEAYHELAAEMKHKKSGKDFYNLNLEKRQNVFESYRERLFLEQDEQLTCEAYPTEQGHLNDQLRQEIVKQFFDKNGNLLTY